MKLPRVNRVRKGGRLYKYHRVTRAALPADVPEDHPAFMAAWTAQEGRKAPPAVRHSTGTIGAGCTAYLGARAFHDLSDGYRPVIRRHVEAIRETWAAARMADLRARHIESDLSGLAPSVARSRRKAWRLVCKYWRKQGWIAEDHSATVATPSLPASDGFTAWTPDDLARYRAHWPSGTPQRRGMELLQWSAARSSDVVTLGRMMVTPAGLLTFKQVKTGQVAMVPWRKPILGMDADHAALMAEIRDCTDLLYLLTVSGKPRSHKAFSGWFADTCRAAGLVDLTAHGLRKYRLNQIAEAGGSMLQIQSWGGHVTLEEVELYTRRADRIRALTGGEQEQNPANRIASLQNGPAKR